MHGLCLGGVFIAISQGVPAGISALILGLQPVVTSTLANRFMAEKVTRLQWVRLARESAVMISSTIPSKILLLGITTHVLERQDRDGWLVGQRRRALSLRKTRRESLSRLLGVPT